MKKSLDRINSILNTSEEKKNSSEQEDTNKQYIQTKEQKGKTIKRYFGN